MNKLFTLFDKFHLCFMFFCNVGLVFQVTEVGALKRGVKKISHTIYIIYIVDTLKVV